MSDEAARGDATIGSSDEGVGLSEYVPQLGIAACYFATVLGGLALADEAASLGLVLFENPDQVGNVGVFAAMVLGFTIVLVAAVRYDRGMDLIRLFLVGSFGVLVADAVVLATGFGRLFTENAALVGLPASPLPIAIAVFTAALLWVYPEWHVLNAVAIVGGAAGIAMLGLSFGPLPIVVLLIVWAAYDAYAVYVSGHMTEVAAGAGSMKVPLVFVVPERRGFSYRDLDGLGLGPEADGSPAAGSEESTGEGGEPAAGSEESTEEGGEPAAADGEQRTPEDDRNTDDHGPDTDPETDADGPALPATLLGLGDALIPGMLAVSAAHFLDAPIVVPALGANLPAMGAVAGGVVGLIALTYVVHHYEGVHAGLPPLNASVLAGYLLGAIAAGIPIASALGL